MSRCLLIQSGLPDYLWGEVISNACHIRNLCPSVAVGDNIPVELWEGEGCDIHWEINRLRVFGCKVWYLISPRGKKFNSRVDVGIFVGYDRQVKDYRIYLPKTKKIIISCHVRFEENVFSCKDVGVDTSNIKKKFSDWIWDVEDFEPEKGIEPIDIEVQSDGENDEGESDFFMDNLINENNQEIQEEAVSVPIVSRRSARLHELKSCNSCTHVAMVCKTQSLCASVNVCEALKGSDA